MKMILLIILLTITGELSKQFSLFDELRPLDTEPLDLDCDLSARLGVFCHVYFSKRAFADHSLQLEAACHSAFVADLPRSRG